MRLPPLRFLLLAAFGTLALDTVNGLVYAGGDFTTAQRG